MTDNVGTYGLYVRNTQRKSPRANFHDYSGGDYFVTICTRDKEHYFGQIVPADVGTALSVVIGGFKRAITMFARRNNIDFGWQSRYHDHIIRDAHDGNRIAEYIENNIARWAEDCYNK